MEFTSSFGVYLKLFMILSYVQFSLQDCLRPTDDLDPNVILTPDKESYGEFYDFFRPSCPAGYTMNGPDIYYCTPGSIWDPDPSTTPVTCAQTCSKPSLSDTSVIILPDQSEYSSGTTIAFSCNGGDVVGPTEATCQNDGTWDYDTEPSCVAGCDAPANTNGTGSYDNSEVVTFKCNPGYALERKADTFELICDDGSWSPATDVCIESGCEEPHIALDLPANLNAVSDEVGEPNDDYYTVNSKVTLSCAGERTLLGPQFSYCNTSGQWDPDPRIARCYDQCPKPTMDVRTPEVTFTSDLTGKTDQTYFDHTDTVRFSCPDGLFLDGPYRASCKNGTWSATIGGHRPVCRANCTAPTNTQNEGQLFRHSEVHVFSCNSTPGMVRMGGPRAFCNDGAWKPRIRCSLKSEL